MQERGLQIAPASPRLMQEQGLKHEPNKPTFIKEQKLQQTGKPQLKHENQLQSIKAQGQQMQLLNGKILQIKGMHGIFTSLILKEC
jgi:hypothetical protein